MRCWTPAQRSMRRQREEHNPFRPFFFFFFFLSLVWFKIKFCLKSFEWVRSRAEEAPSSGGILIPPRSKPIVSSLTDPCLFSSLHSEHTPLPDYKGGGGQRRADGIFSLHRQRTQEGQFPPVASGEIYFHRLTSALNHWANRREEGVFDPGPPLDINVLFGMQPLVWIWNLLILGFWCLFSGRLRSFCIYHLWFTRKNITRHTRSTSCSRL